MPTSPFHRWAVQRRATWQPLDLVAGFGSLAVTVAAFVLNLGWARVALMLTAVPLVLVLWHGVLTLVVVGMRLKVRAFHALCLTHPLAYLLLPDVADIGPTTLAFGQVRLTAVPALAETLVVVAMALLLGTLLLCAAVSAQVWRDRSGATETA